MIIDVFYYLIVAWALYKGYSRGLIVALFSFFAYLIGLAAALKLSAVVTGYFWQGEDSPRLFWPVLSFLLVFAAVVLLVNLLARLIRKSLSLITLGWLDKAGGILLYLTLYTILYSTLLFYAVSLDWIDSQTVERSAVYKLIAPVGPLSMDYLGRIVPFFKDVFGELSRLFEKLGEHFVR